MDDERIRSLSINGSLDLSLEYRRYRLRLHIFKERRSYSLSIRILPFLIKSFEELNLPKVLNKVIYYEKGLVLITGSTGSGKSTTLASLIENINLNSRKNIITIEDPIEYIYENKKSIIRQRQIGMDVIDFSQAIKDCVREDPDIIVLGEIRDLESIEAALDLSELGHLVLATVHTNSAVETISRIINVFPSDRSNKIRFQLASNLKMVVSQSLIESKITGLVPLVEVLVCDNACRNIISQAKNLSNLENHMQINGRNLGCQTKEESYKDLKTKGLVK